MQRSIEINPNYSRAYGSLATIQNYAGTPEPAIQNNQIALRNRLKCQPSQSRQEKYVFDDDGSGEKKRKLQAEYSQNRDQRVAHRVAPQGLPAGQPLGPCRADVIFVQGVQKRGSHDPRQDGGLW